jgi:hypothetical protein
MKMRLKPRPIPTAPGSQEEKTSRAKRSRCRIFATLFYLAGSTPIKIADISTTGMGLDLAGPFRGAIGSKVRIECTELGTIEGIVRWMREGRLGLEFDVSSNAAAKVTAYFRFFHKETLPILRR